MSDKDKMTYHTDLSPYEEFKTKCASFMCNQYITDKIEATMKSTYTSTEINNFISNQIKKSEFIKQYQVSIDLRYSHTTCTKFNLSIKRQHE